jgi:hypothetical protein
MALRLACRVCLHSSCSSPPLRAPPLLRILSVALQRAHLVQDISSEWLSKGETAHEKLESANLQSMGKRPKDMGEASDTVHYYKPKSAPSSSSLKVVDDGECRRCWMRVKREGARRIAAGATVGGASAAAAGAGAAGYVAVGGP